MLQQDRYNACESFLQENIGKVFISEFSLHSIGVILFRYKKQILFSQFCSDVLPLIPVLSLSEINEVREIASVSEKYNLDFDDAYQVKVCETYDLELFTMDNDFKKVTSDLRVHFL